MNMLENPVYPDIKKAPPRFVWSKKHWQVDVGATLMDTEVHTQFLGDAVLAQSRDYNKTVYGQTSHKDIVNANFRPPLLDPYEDSVPLTRIPCTTRAIHGRINPQTVHDGYQAKNERKNDIDAHLTDRISTAQIRPTFFRPMDLPQDNSVLPDLEMVLPAVSASAGFKTPYTVNPECAEVNLEYTSLKPSGDSGFSTPYVLDGYNRVEDVQLADNRPSVSASAGYVTRYRADIETPVIELYDNKPNVSASAGYRSNYRADIETPVAELTDNRPNVSASAGVRTNYETHISSQLSNNDIILESKLDAPLYAGNPEMQFRSRNEVYTDVDSVIRENKPSVSYSVRPEVGYRERNEGHNIHFRQKLAPAKGSAKLTNASAIPKRYIETPNIRMKSQLEMAGAPKSRKYRLG